MGVDDEKRERAEMIRKEMMQKGFARALKQAKAPEEIQEEQVEEEQPPQQDVVLRVLVWEKEKKLEGALLTTEHPAFPEVDTRFGQECAIKDGSQFSFKVR